MAVQQELLLTQGRVLMALQVVAAAAVAVVAIPTLLVASTGVCKVTVAARMQVGATVMLVRTRQQLNSQHVSAGAHAR